MSSSSSQIIIFSADGCKYCERAKFLLFQYHPTVLDVDAFPHRYQQAARFTGNSSVPLIFVGNEYIGGTSELEAKMPYVVQKISSKTPTIDGSNDNNNEFPPFLRLPLTSEERQSEKQIMAKKQQTLNQELNFLEQNQISELRFNFNPEGSATNGFSYSEVLEYLRFHPASCLTPQDRGGVVFGKHPKTVSGKELFDVCRKFLHNKAKIAFTGFDENLANKAKEMIVQLLNCQMIYDVAEHGSLDLMENIDSVKKSAWDDPALISASTLYRFAVDACSIDDFAPLGKFILNSDRNASKSFEFKNFTRRNMNNNNNNNNTNPTNSVALTSTQAVSLSRALWRCQHLLMTEFRDPKNGLVDCEGELHEKIVANPTRVQHYATFKQLASLLQLVDLSLLSDKEKICFGINMYNSLVYMGFAEFYVPWSTMQKVAFFGEVGVFIGKGKGDKKEGEKKLPLFFSLNDIENGLLRGNRKGLTDVFATPFSLVHDARISLPVRNVDYRIHFALDCGTKSCPPIKVFSVENLDQELEFAGKAFIQHTSRFDAANNKIVTSQIFKWYQVDFDSKVPKYGDDHNNNTNNNSEVVEEQNVQSVILKYLGVDRKQVLLSSSKTVKKLAEVAVEYSEYDWTFDAKQK